MKAQLLKEVGSVSEERPALQLADVPEPRPGTGEILIRVSACGVCHTELDEIEGRTPPPHFPVIPGHQVVGHVAETGAGSRRFQRGDRVGVAWVYSACGTCRHCLAGDENLCPKFVATGRDADGGYAEYMVVRDAFAYPIPDVFSDEEAAPLLCAGAIGYRSLRLAAIRDGDRLGLTGFGASAHLVLEMVQHRYPRSEVFVFARSQTQRSFALERGAAWAGDTTEPAPAKLAAVIDTTPAWKPVVEALANLDAGGRLVINAIRKEDADKDHLLTLDYPRHLWMEKEVKSVANVARVDVLELLQLAAEIPIRPSVETYAFEDANRALLELKRQSVRGAKVLKIV